MGFAAPLALLGLLGIVLPIVAHLLRRRDLPVRPLPTIALLRKAEAASRRKVRVVDLVLLAARIALVATAALGLAAPYTTETLAWGDGRLASVAIVIDDSMSMSRRELDGAPIERAVARAREVIDALPEGSEVALVLAGTPPRLAVPRTDDLALARARLDEVHGGGARGTALADAVELAARQLAGARHPLQRIVVLSDLARHVGAEAIAAPPPIALQFERVGGERAAPNLAVVDAIATPDPSVPGTLAIAVEVRAWNDTRERAPIVVRRAGVEIGRGEMALAAGGGRTVIRVSAPEGPDPTAEVRLMLDPPDALALDDARGVLLRPASAPRVLLVDGDPRPLGRRAHDRSGEGVRLLGQALSLAPRESGGIVHRTVDPHTFLGAALTDVDVIVLADVSLADGTLRSRLEEHVAGGGGLLVVAGDRVTPGDASRLASPRLGSLLPARVVAIANGEVRGVVRGSGGTLLPPGPTGLENLTARRRLILEPEDGAAIALAWSDGIPALVLGPEARAERGRVAVLGIGLDEPWSDLPYRPGFLPLAVQLVRALAPPGTMPDAPFPPGSAPPLRPPLGVSSVALIAPDGSVIEYEVRAPARPIDLKDAIAPGAWRVRVARPGEAPREVPRAAFVVAPPVSESDLTPGPEPDAGGAPAEVRTRAGTTVRRSLAPWVFALVGLLALAEGALRFPRRGRSRAPPRAPARTRGG